MSTFIEGNNKIEDPFYRYKRKKINVEKRRNTCAITNLQAVAKSMDQEPEYLLEFFKHKFNLRFKESNGEYITTKSLTTEEVEESINDFTEHYVLCNTCRLPETEYYLEKEKLRVKCRACGSIYNMKSSSTKKVIIKNLKKK